MSRSIHISVLVKPILVLFSCFCICFIVSCNGVGDAMNMKQQPKNSLLEDENKKSSNNDIFDLSDMKKSEHSDSFLNIQEAGFYKFMSWKAENNIALYISSLTEFLTNSEYDEIASTLKSSKKNLYLSFPNLREVSEDDNIPKETFEKNLSMIIKENPENSKNISDLIFLAIIGGHDKGFSLHLRVGPTTLPTEFTRVSFIPIVASPGLTLTTNKGSCEFLTGTSSNSVLERFPNLEYLTIKDGFSDENLPIENYIPEKTLHRLHYLSIMLPGNKISVVYSFPTLCEMIKKNCRSGIRLSIGFSIDFEAIIKFDLGIQNASISLFSNFADILKRNFEPIIDFLMAIVYFTPFSNQINAFKKSKEEIQVYQKLFNKCNAKQPLLYCLDLHYTVLLAIMTSTGNGNDYDNDGQ